MKRRFIVIVLDGFGMGATKDAAIKRPGDERACTIGSILKDHPDLYLPNLEKLGLMNAYGKESEKMKFAPDANFGKAELMHFGADTFMGHQEIMGTLPKDPEMTPFQQKVDIVAEHLKNYGHKVEIVEREGLRYVVCDDYCTVADNLEADLGMCYNVTAPLDYLPFDKEVEIARQVREVVTVGRVVVFGKEALLTNEHGRPRPERAAVCSRLFRRETTISTAACAAILEEELAKAGIQPPFAVTDSDGKRPFGVLTREGRMADGRRTLLVVNLLAKPVSIDIPGNWHDVLGEGPVSGATPLPTGSVLVLVQDEIEEPVTDSL